MGSQHEFTVRKGCYQRQQSPLMKQQCQQIGGDNVKPVSKGEVVPYKANPVAKGG